MRIRFLLGVIALRFGAICESSFGLSRVVRRAFATKAATRSADYTAWRRRLSTSSDPLAGCVLS